MTTDVCLEKDSPHCGNGGVLAFFRMWGLLQTFFSLASFQAKTRGSEQNIQGIGSLKKGQHPTMGKMQHCYSNSNRRMNSNVDIFQFGPFQKLDVVFNVFEHPFNF